jgi:hypothetical protein
MRNDRNQEFVNQIEEWKKNIEGTSLIFYYTAFRFLNLPCQGTLILNYILNWNTRNKAAYLSVSNLSKLLQISEEEISVLLEHFKKKNYVTIETTTYNSKESFGYWINLPKVDKVIKKEMQGDKEDKIAKLKKQLEYLESQK